MKVDYLVRVVVVEDFHEGLSLLAIGGIGAPATQRQKLHLYAAELCQGSPSNLALLELTGSGIELHQVCRNACIKSDKAGDPPACRRLV